ncbi:hypothetical protein [Paenibacillus sp. Marseille-Q4541]|uniref:hypothetical protein n=1 Tax=Paenibacillus sp. Marseille-Q4541 TaxID=2831522 RepID=UPI001BAA42D0|nr:hypothetical protein [Paenibacillus sp. Marseille-Q4541]
MRITDYAVLFVLIMFPMFWVYSLHGSDDLVVTRLEQKYNQSIQTAVQDASRMMHQNENPSLEASYDSVKSLRVDKDLILNTFMQTISINFGIMDDLPAQRTFLNYLPALAVIDYDGFYLYRSATYTDTEGNEAEKHSWTEKKLYVYEDDDGNIFRFTLDDYVYVYVNNAGQWLEGYRDEMQSMASVPLLQDADTFEHVRRQTIVSTIEDNLSYAIQSHNDHTLRNGSVYQFTLPIISQEEWYNTIDDVGVMAFIQGIPVGDEYYNNYAFGSGRLVKKDVMIGAVEESTGSKYFYKSGCEFPYTPVERFSSAKEAAANGYYERTCYQGQGSL